MNLTVHSDRPVDLTVHMMFVENVPYEFKMRLAGQGPAVFTIVGRWPQDLVHMDLEYNGARYAHPIEVVGEHLKDIHIYGGRDQWSQLLRERAMKAEAEVQARE
jgi:hypothetical protein